MSEKLIRPMALTDTEIDEVAGGANPVIDQNMVGLIAVGVVVQDVNVNVGTGVVNNA